MSEYVWIFGALTSVISLATFYGGWAVARYRGENAGEVAKHAASDVVILRAELAAYKLEVQGKFATIEMLQKSEDRVADALNRLADRLDRLVEARPHPPANPKVL